MDSQINYIEPIDFMMAFFGLDIFPHSVGWLRKLFMILLFCAINFLELRELYGFEFSFKKISDLEPFFYYLENYVIIICLVLKRGAILQIIFKLNTLFSKNDRNYLKQKCWIAVAFSSLMALLIFAVELIHQILSIGNLSVMRNYYSDPGTNLFKWSLLVVWTFIESLGCEQMQLFIGCYYLYFVLVIKRAYEAVIKPRLKFIRNPLADGAFFLSFTNDWQLVTSIGEDFDDIFKLHPLIWLIRGFVICFRSVVILKYESLVNTKYSKLDKYRINFYTILDFLMIVAVIYVVNQANNSINSMCKSAYNLSRKTPSNGSQSNERRRMELDLRSARGLPLTVGGMAKLEPNVLVGIFSSVVGLSVLYLQLADNTV